jgi:DNA-binding PadR family transcriptional regulator
MASELLNPTAASILGFLHHGPMTGWSIFETCEATIGPFWNVTRSQVYRELNDLEERRLVKAGSAGPRGRTPFTITATGRKAFATWLDSPPAPDTIRSPLLLTVFFGAQLAPERLAAMVSAQRAVHADLLSRYEGLLAAVGRDADPFVRATIDFGVRHERALVEWLEALVESFPEGP